MSPPVCAIPGAGPGNGRALARRFAAAGYRVALIARRDETVAASAEGLDAAHGYVCDVTDGAAVEATFKAIAAELGPVETLLYNAGNAVFGSVDEVEAADLEAAWRTNTLGLFHCTRAVLPGMRAAGAGHIVVSGATASRKGGARFAGFAQAKAAQYSLAQSLARQLGPEGIHVAIAIIDGVVATPRTREMMPDRPDTFFLDADAIAESVYQITRQPPSAWTFEFDLRPFGERW